MKITHTHHHRTRSVPVCLDLTNSKTLFFIDYLRTEWEMGLNDPWRAKEMPTILLSVAWLKYHDIKDFKHFKHLRALLAKTKIVSFFGMRDDKTDITYMKDLFTGQRVTPYHLMITVSNPKLFQSFLDFVKDAVADGSANDDITYVNKREYKNRMQDMVRFQSIIEITKT